MWAAPRSASSLHEVRKELEVPALVGAHRDRRDVLLDRRQRDLVDRPVVAEMDHLGALRLQDPAHDVDRRVVAVEQRRRGQHPHRIARYVQLWLVHLSPTTRNLLGRPSISRRRRDHHLRRGQLALAGVCTVVCRWDPAAPGRCSSWPCATSGGAATSTRPASGGPVRRTSSAAATGRPAAAGACRTCDRRHRSRAQPARTPRGRARRRRAAECCRWPRSQHGADWADHVDVPAMASFNLVLVEPGSTAVVVVRRQRHCNDSRSRPAAICSSRPG